MGRVSLSPLGIGFWKENFIMPEDSASKISALMGDSGEITICHNGDKMILFTGEEFEKFEIITTSVSRKFPDTEMLFGKMGKDFISINTLEFKSAIQRLKLYASSSDSDKRFIMSFDGNETVTMSSKCENFLKDGEEVITIR